VAWKNNFLHLPLVNIWLEDFRKRCLHKDPSFGKIFPFQFIPTYDIDMAWSYRNKGLSRNAGGMVRDVVSLQFAKAKERWKVIRGESEDPFDAYEWMDALHERYGLKPVYFFLMAQKSGKYDKNISVHDPDFVQLVQQLTRKYETGIHPSWESNEHADEVGKEKQMLERIAGHSISKSRQHYIRFQLPDTFGNLVAAGIESDYSMGYGSVNGFRASVATPFFWYDLPNEKTTRLKLFPFCFMDATAHYEEKLDASQSLLEMRKYLEVVRSCNGTLITIWHNSFLGTDPTFEGWREMYETFIQSVDAQLLTNGSPGTRQQA
jgi:hypothetical protein